MQTSAVSMLIAGCAQEFCARESCLSRGATLPQFLHQKIGGEDRVPKV
jgi:hypothetical protein